MMVMSRIWNRAVDKEHMIIGEDGRNVGEGEAKEFDKGGGRREIGLMRMVMMMDRMWNNEENIEGAAECDGEEDAEEEEKMDEDVDDDGQNVE